MAPSPGIVAKLLAERGARARQARLHRAHGAADDLGHLGFGQILEVEQNHRPGVLGEAHQRALDFSGDDLPEPVQLDVPPEPVLLGRAERPRLDGVEAAHGRVVALAAVLADERVAEDPEEPRFEVGARRELACRGEGAHIGLLDEVLGVRLASGEIPGEVVQGVGVRQGLPPEHRLRVRHLLVPHPSAMISPSWRPRFSEAAIPTYGNASPSESFPGRPLPPIDPAEPWARAPTWRRDPARRPPSPRPRPARLPRGPPRWRPERTCAVTSAGRSSRSAVVRAGGDRTFAGAWEPVLTRSPVTPAAPRPVRGRSVDTGPAAP